MITPRSRTATRPLFAALGALVLLSGLLPMARISTADAAGPNVDLTALDVAYTQNFDTLASERIAQPGPTTNTIPGWFHARTGTGNDDRRRRRQQQRGQPLQLRDRMSLPIAPWAPSARATRPSATCSGASACPTARVRRSRRWTSPTPASSGATAARLAAQTVAFSYLVGTTDGRRVPGRFPGGWDGRHGTRLHEPHHQRGRGCPRRQPGGKPIGTLVHDLRASASRRDGDHAALVRPRPHGRDHGLSIDDFSVTPHSGPARRTLTINDVSLT